MTRRVRTDLAGQPIGEVDRAVGRKQLQEIQEAESDLRDQPLTEMLELQHDPGDEELHRFSPSSG